MIPVHSLNKKGGYFAASFIRYHIVFIASDRFVMAGQETTNHRNSFALVNQAGMITKNEVS